MISQGQPYERYAAIYDRLGQRRFGERLAAVMLDWLAERGEHPQQAADLACGTGAAACIFAARGLHVIAIDRSPAMLAAARESVAPNMPVTWILGDLRDLPAVEPVDLAACVYDSVNYLTEDADLEAFFAGVARLLVPGGWFIFDLLTAARYADSWDDTTVVAHDSPGLFVIYRSRFQRDTGLSPLRLTAFSRQPGSPGTWDRFDEDHLERAYPIDAVARRLEHAGFTVAEIRDYNDVSGTLGGPGSEESERVVVFAQLSDQARGG